MTASRPVRAALPVLALLALLAPAGVARAEDAAPAAREDEATLAAWQRLREFETADRAAQAEGSAKVQAAQTDEEKKAIRDELWKGIRERGKRTERAAEAFRLAFAKTDWATWSPTARADLLERGLMEVGQHGVDEDPALAVRAFETVLRVLPACPSAVHARCTWLPIALPAAGDLPRARQRCEELLADAPEERRPDLRMQIGDVFALEGRYEDAQKAYAEARAAIPPDVKPSDMRSHLKGYLDLRVQTIGHAAPEVDSPTWMGADAKPLSALRGRVVVLDFWATWCGPCCHGIPGMVRLHEDLAKQGVAVLGVTTTYKNGFLPSGRDQLLYNFKDGETSQLVDKDGKIDEKANLDLLGKFRERLAIPYPFVVAKSADFAAYRVTGIPTVFVVGKDGRIGFVAVGSCRERLIRAAVERLMKEPAPGDPAKRAAPAAGTSDQ